MSPREVTSSYADYFFALDQYEHTHAAAAAGNNFGNNANANNNTPPPPPAINTNNNTTNNDMEGDDAGSSVSFVDGTQGVQQQMQHVDPLSIDPTLQHHLPTTATLLTDEEMDVDSGNPESTSGDDGDADNSLRLSQRRRVGEVWSDVTTPPRTFGTTDEQNSANTSSTIMTMPWLVASTPGSPDTGTTQSTPDLDQSTLLDSFTTAIDHRNIRTIPRGNVPPPPILRFCPRSTTITDLKYFAERGCIVPLLAALETPRLVALGARLLADYAKCSTRRVAVASNRRILEFLMTTMNSNRSVRFPSLPEMQGREYAVECIRSLTATEESDSHLLKCPGMLDCLAGIAGLNIPEDARLSMELNLSPRQSALYISRATKSRLHASIAIMNLSCGKMNKPLIASTSSILNALNHLLQLDFAGSTVEVILKGVTCIKNLSNADVNDAVLLRCGGLVTNLGHVAKRACLYVCQNSNDIATANAQLSDCAQQACTNACLALMNLSISKSNKYTVFKSPFIMESLMFVLENGKGEARVKACSALSNLAIGYSNKIPMLHYPGFVQCILNLITDRPGPDGDNSDSIAIQAAVRTKACSILWSFAAESKNQVPVVRRGDILPVLVQVANEDTLETGAGNEARFKCIAALTLLAESAVNATALLEAGSLAPLMEILRAAGPDPTRWTGQTPSWCVGFLMNLSQSYDAVPYLREAGVVELLAPLLTLDHYQSLKAAMACTFILSHPTTAQSGSLYDLHAPPMYDLLRQIETTIPKIVSLLTNTLHGKGGAGYKYGVFTLRSSVGCIAALSTFPDFIKAYLCTPAVIAGLGRVVRGFCVDGGEDPSIVGGGREDGISASLAVQALHALITYLIPNESCTLFFSHYKTHKQQNISNQNNNATADLEQELIYSLKSFALVVHEQVSSNDKELAKNVVARLDSVLGFHHKEKSNSSEDPDNATMAQLAIHESNHKNHSGSTISTPSAASSLASAPGNHMTSMARHHFHYRHQQQGYYPVIPTFILTDRSGRRFTVPYEYTGGRAFNDCRQWCYRRGRFCFPGEVPDVNFVWTQELQNAYEAVLSRRKSAPTALEGPNAQISGKNHVS